MKLLISTTNRHVHIDEPTGYIFTYDFAANQVIQKSIINEPPFLKENPNPRGGLRGQKGFSLYQDKIGFVNSSTIFIYDKNWNPILYFFHPSCASIHELAITQDGVWVTSTGNDLLFLFDHQGKLKKFFDVRQMEKILQTTGWVTRPFLSHEDIQNGRINFRDPRTHDLINTDKAHINSVFPLEDGSVLISLGLLKNSNFSRLLSLKSKLVHAGIWKWFLSINSYLRKNYFKTASESKGEMLIQPATGISAVAKVTQNGEVTPVLFFGGSSVPSHSVRLLKNGTGIYLNSTAGELVNFELNSGKVLFTDQVGSKFLRGARQLSDGTLVMGDGNHFIHYDIENKKIIQKIKFTDESAPSVFDFCELPDDFEIPPPSFPEHHNKFMPVNQLSNS